MPDGGSDEGPMKNRRQFEASGEVSALVRQVFRFDRKW
jgi:hypothetical protein